MNVLRRTLMYRTKGAEMKIRLFSILPLLFMACSACASQEVTVTFSAPDSGTECDVYDIVGRWANEALESVPLDARKKMEAYSFARYNPLYKFDIPEKSIESAISSIRSDLDRCHSSQHEEIDDVYRSMFRDERWGPITLILAMVQQVQHKRLNMVEPYIGFLLDLLNSGVVPPHAPQTCGSRLGARSAMYQPNGASEWFRIRILNWVECKDGELLVYLPELGWKQASQEQIDAIRASNPTCCRGTFSDHPEQKP